MPLHGAAATIVGAYLEAVDHEAPGLIVGLYLIGSAALDEFRPRTSDIDFLAVTSHRPDAAEVAALGRAHARLRKRWPWPFFDGRYVTADELATDPRQVGAGPY